MRSSRGRNATTALAPAEARRTSLGRAVAPRCGRRPGKSGIRALEDPRNAFAARVLLARTAERTIDAQYYIWRDDITGGLLLDELHAAAQRGVRVRLLLDDNGIAGLDAQLLALDRHPSIEVRLYNPFSVRRPRWLGYLIDFARANRRMHNKSFTVDNQATIVGGRNIGDEYFGATEQILFADLDVLAVGPVVQDVSADFDHYWSSRSACPVARVVSRASARGPAARGGRRARDAAAAAYLEAVRSSPFARDLLAGRLALSWADTRMVSDDPAKSRGEARDEQLLTHQLEQMLGTPARSLSLVSPYFVPTAPGAAAFARVAARGVDVRILTNSLAATDVAPVHAGYAKRRKALLEAGVRLYEMRPESAADEPEGGTGPFGSKASSLHAKTFAVDGRRVFVGSFNFDPRSARLNTELGFVIDSPVLAGRIERAFAERIPEHSYEVRLDARGEVHWLERRDGELVRHDIEPRAGLWERAAVRVLAFLPIEWLL